MSTADRYRATFRRMLTHSGETVTFRRGTSTATCLARIYVEEGDRAMEPTVDSLMQRRRRSILLAEDLDGSGITMPPVRGDEVIDAAGKVLFVEHVDDETRRINGVPVGYSVMLIGA